MVGGYAERLGPFVGREDESATVVDSVVGAHAFVYGHDTIRLARRARGSRRRSSPTAGRGLRRRLRSTRPRAPPQRRGPRRGCDQPRRDGAKRRTYSGAVRRRSDVGVGAHRECGPHDAGSSIGDSGSAGSKAGLRARRVRPVSPTITIMSASP